jgi:hypothetical protein
VLVSLRRLFGLFCGWKHHSGGSPCPLPAGHSRFTLLIEHHIDCYGRRLGDRS